VVENEQEAKNEGNGDESIVAMATDLKNAAKALKYVDIEIPVDRSCYFL
jgi:hypothetical protein